MVSFYSLKLYNIKHTPLPKTEDFEKKDLEKNTHNKMAFYQQIRTNSQIVSEAKKNASDAKVASDTALCAEWIDTNWTPLKKSLEKQIEFASDQGAFSVNVEVRTKIFKDMSDSPSFKTIFKSVAPAWRDHWSILGFIKLISKSCEEDHNILNQFESIPWANKGFLDGFVIKHTRKDFSFEEIDNDWVEFDISWNQWFQGIRIRQNSLKRPQGSERKKGHTAKKNK